MDNVNMNGHERRRQRISDRIKKVALELFSNYGIDKVSMDEVAIKAQVSKVTIYKYFHSKEELRQEVVDLYINEVLATTEKILQGDMDLLEKLKLALGAGAVFSKLTDNRALFAILDAERQAGYTRRFKEIMRNFFEQGKQAGYIDSKLSFDLLYLYYEIFQAGMMVKSVEVAHILSDPQSLNQFLDLYYFGIFRKKI